MSLARQVLNELFGLFVDDGSLAVAILALVAALAALARLGLVTPPLGGGLLALGLAGLLLENLFRSARKFAARR